MKPHTSFPKLHIGLLLLLAQCATYRDLRIATIPASTTSTPSEDGTPPSHDAVAPNVPDTVTSSPNPPSIPPGEPRPWNTDASARGFESLEPLYAAQFHDGWVTLLHAYSDGNAVEHMTRVLNGTKRLWAGHREIPEQVTSIGPVYLVSTSGVTPMPMFLAVGMMVEGYWTIDYRRGQTRGPAIFTTGEPVPHARVRSAKQPETLPASSTAAAQLRELIAENNADDGRRIAAEHKRRAVTYSIQMVAGSFPGGDRVVVLSAEHPEGEHGARYSASFITDAMGEPRLHLHPPASDELDVIEGSMDLDGDGFDEILVDGIGFDSRNTKLYHPLPDRVDTFVLYEHFE